MSVASDWATGCNSRADEAQRRGKRKSLSALSENQDEGEANGPSGTCPIPAPAFRTWPMLSRLHGLCSWGRGKLWPEPSLTSLQKRRQRGRNKILLESDVARKTAGRNEIEIAGEGDRARVLGSPNLDSWGRAAKDIPRSHSFHPGGNAAVRGRRPELLHFLISEERMLSRSWLPDRGNRVGSYRPYISRVALKARRSAANVTIWNQILPAREEGRIVLFSLINMACSQRAWMPTSR